MTISLQLPVQGINAPCRWSQIHSSSNGIIQYLTTYKLYGHSHIRSTGAPDFGYGSILPRHNPDHKRRYNDITMTSLISLYSLKTFGNNSKIRLSIQATLVTTTTSMYYIIKIISPSYIFLGYSSR